MSMIDNIAAKLTKVEIQYLVNNPDKLANVWNDLQAPKKTIKIKVGDCFCAKDCLGNISLIKVISVDDHDWFYCDEISIDIDEHADIDYYDVSYHIDDFSNWKPIDANLYENALILVNSREDAVTKVIEQFDNQIRKLCQEVNQNQENQ